MPASGRHETDMPKYLGDVRCWVNSGKHMLASSFSGFDPVSDIGPSEGRPDYGLIREHRQVGVEIAIDEPAAQ